MIVEYGDIQYGRSTLINVSKVSHVLLVGFKVFVLYDSGVEREIVCNSDEEAQKLYATLMAAFRTIL